MFSRLLNLTLIGLALIGMALVAVGQSPAVASSEPWCENSTATPIERKIIVKVFYPLNGSRGASEICGRVEGGVLAGDQIVITADPKHNPGIYVTHPAPDGNFCHVIVSATGRASLELVNLQTKSESVEVLTDISTTRFPKAP